MDAEPDNQPKAEPMFTIEFVVFDDDRPDYPRVIEKVPSSRFFLYDVEHLAKLMLKKAKRRSPIDSLTAIKSWTGKDR